MNIHRLLWIFHLKDRELESFLNAKSNGFFIRKLNEAAYGCAFGKTKDTKVSVSMSTKGSKLEWSGSFFDLEIVDKNGRKIKPRVFTCDI